MDYTLADAGALVRRVSRPADPGKLSVYSTFRDEMALAPAFLAHYRAMGVEQFLIVDDGSTDGTREYLAAQTDCVVIETHQPYGAPIRYRAPGGAVQDQRAGVYYKAALPQHFCPGAYVAYFDADEFLILPPGVRTLAEVVETLRAEGAPSAVASVVEFFPETVAGLEGAMPQSFEALLAAYAWFEPEPLVRLRPGAQPELIGASKTAQLFDRYEVRPTIERRGWHRLYMPARAKKAQAFQKSPRHKTPLLRRDAESYAVGSHNGSLPPSSTVLLTIAHFVFTGQFAEKIARARAWGSHTDGAAKYRYYATLLDKMQAAGGSFLGPQSVRYEASSQLLEAGLMRYPSTARAEGHSSEI